MVHRLNRFSRRDKGAVAVVTALLVSAVFIGLTALVVDLGMARDTRRQAQNAADASALAAGNVLYPTGTVNITSPTGAIAAAKAFALKNYGVTEPDWVACTDPLALSFHPDTVCISFDPNAIAPTSVRVNIPVRSVSTPFAKIWGVSSVPVGAAAQITLVAGGKSTCGLCIVGLGTHNLQNGTIDVSGTNVAINGTLSSNPQGSIIAVSGGSISLDGDLPNQGTYSPAPAVDQLPVADPLEHLVMPAYGSLMPQNLSRTNSCTYGPGIYDHLTACNNMIAGLYVLTGPTHMSGSELIVANGVTLYFVCGTPAAPRPCNAGGETGGDLLMTGNAILNNTPPTAPAANAGISIIADPNNTATYSFRGNGAQTNSGTIYAKSGTLDVRGNGVSNLRDSLVVVGDVSFSGSNATFNSAYTVAANYAIDSWDSHLSQ